MKKVCAWCQLDMIPSWWYYLARRRKDISHGICEWHLSMMRQDYDKHMKSGGRTGG